MCTDILEIWFGIANRQILSILTVLSARDMAIFSFSDDNLSKYQLIFTKLGMCIDIVRIWSGIAKGEISSVFDRVMCPHYENTSVQIYWKFTKKENFQIRNSDIFHISAQNP